jgi:hypothetical protein
MLPAVPRIDHFEQLRTDPVSKGPKGELRISYDGLGKAGAAQSLLWHISHTSQPSYQIRQINRQAVTF